MNLSLFIITLVGLATLLICYLIISFRSFKHHIVTGILSLLPVVNLLIIPSVWYQIRKPFLISMLAILVASAAWFLGGNKYNTLNSVISNNQSSNSTSLASNTQTIPLPQKPLYYVKYRVISQSKIAQTLDQSIRVTLTNSTQLQGRNQSVNKSTLQLLVGYNDEQQIVEVALRDIKVLEIINDQE